MADIAKLKRRSTLGPPPPLTEASPNLEAPEIAPAPAPVRTPARTASAAAAPRPAPRTASVARPGGVGVGLRPCDGRSARRSGRTVQFATRVSPEFDERVRVIAEREGILLVEVLERALDAYEGGGSGE